MNIEFRCSPRPQVEIKSDSLYVISYKGDDRLVTVDTYRCVLRDIQSREALVDLRQAGVYLPREVKNLIVEV